MAQNKPPYRTIDSFFGKKSTAINEKDAHAMEVDTVNPSENTSSSQNASSKSQELEIEIDDAIQVSSDNSFSMNSASINISSANSNAIPGIQNDVGRFVQKINQLSDFQKHQLLTNHWTPPSDYTFPHSSHNKKGKIELRSVKPHHFDEHEWLVFSDHSNGLFCKYCVIFAKSPDNISLNKFVVSPVTSFAKLTGKDGDISVHEKRSYHIDAVMSGQQFILNFKNPSLNVINQVSSARRKQVLENRERLVPIIKTILFCGRRNIPLRGHRDDGKLQTEPSKESNESSVINEGNFRGLLEFRIDSGDHGLKDHLESTHARATYISKTTQNDLISACEDFLQSKIIQRVKTAPSYAIIFDETTDVSRTEQMSLSVRYVFEGKIREDFLTFIDCFDKIREDDVENGEKRLTGVALGHIVLDLLDKFGLDPLKCIGIGTDNCSVMASEMKGAASCIKEKCKNATRSPCFSHSLNNSLARGSKIHQVRNTISIMKSVISFSHASAKRQDIFKKHLHQSLHGLCETRWVERHTTVIQFKEGLSQIIDALDEISQWMDVKTSSDAISTIKSLVDSEFLVTLFCLEDILSVTKPLSIILQTKCLDLNAASNHLKSVLSVLKTSRSDANSHFGFLFQKITEMAQKLKVTITVPRITSRQKHRSNHQTTSPEEYYRVSIFIPLLEEIVTDLESRLPEDTLNCFKLNLLLPSFIKESSIDEFHVIEEIQSLYAAFLGKDNHGLLGEARVWREFWTQSEMPTPQTALDAIDFCGETFSSVKLILTLLATIPVTVATAERSFSSLKRIKTWLRSTMSEERLNGLALLHIHQDIAIDINEIINRFASQKHRRLEFVL